MMQWIRKLLGIRPAPQPTQEPLSVFESRVLAHHGLTLAQWSRRSHAERATLRDQYMKAHWH